MKILCPAPRFQKASGCCAAPLPSPTVVVLAAPSGLRRPVAFAATVIAAAVALTAITVPEAVLWFAPVLLVKLLLGHLLPEEASP